MSKSKSKHIEISRVDSHADLIKRLRKNPPKSAVRSLEFSDPQDEGDPIVKEWKHIPIGIKHDMLDALSLTRVIKSVNWSYSGMGDRTCTVTIDVMRDFDHNANIKGPRHFKQTVVGVSADVIAADHRSRVPALIREAESQAYAQLGRYFGRELNHDHEQHMLADPANVAAPEQDSQSRKAEKYKPVFALADQMLKDGKKISEITPMMVAAGIEPAAVNLWSENRTGEKAIG